MEIDFLANDQKKLSELSEDQIGRLCFARYVMCSKPFSLNLLPFVQILQKFVTFLNRVLAPFMVYLRKCIPTSCKISELFSANFDFSNIENSRQTTEV